MEGSSKELGLNADELDDASWTVVYQIYQEHKKRLDEAILIIETAKARREVNKPRLTLW